MGGIKHKFTSGIADGLDNTLVQPSDWNDDHDITGATIERAVQALSDYVMGLDGSATDDRGFPIGFLRIGRQHTVIADELFIGNSYEGGILPVVSGSGASGNTGTAASPNHPGILVLNTGTTTTGRAALITNTSVQSIQLGGGRVRFGVCFRLPVLSDGTDTFTIRAGTTDSSTGNDGNHAILFRYSHGVNGGRWEGVTRDGGAETALDTGITVDTNFHTLEWEVNADASSVEFFVDATSAGTITTNIPSIATSRLHTLSPASILKSAGTTARTLQVDAYWYIFEFTTAR